MRGLTIKKLTILAMMIALDVVLSPLFRIEGMAPMSSVMNVIAGVALGPVYGTIMAFLCASIRMLFLGIPPLAMTGAIFGAFLAGCGYRLTKKTWGACLGEIIGTGLIGSLVSYPVMVWFTGSEQALYWFIYTPRFFGGAISGSIIGWFALLKLDHIPAFKHIQVLFGGRVNEQFNRAIQRTNK
ncbi:energy coupling factor transporter S component ThiW [Vagococcus penaei]|uniref:Energy coupling factor transporter S component ThiW n=1 Tax=Vagococcus penaei TaxID=633807 RepID=A0A1Q2D338_9ENTE|nr:energy coupling factor transporter S component ThiW [Vagococcus penaei]AQP52770.1 energy coupling factor transporter S component ThiW [Vagococcus penaei]RST98458.1 energy coupling factor transporter S component ThiW [Vagococcus penaei]